LDETRIVKVERENLAEVVELAAETIRRGGIVAYPTDTLYGLGVDPFSQDAVRRLLKAKRRPLDKGIPVLVYSLEAAEKIACFTLEALLLAERFWPGPLTIILGQRVPVPSEVSGGRGNVGLRVPNHPVPRLIAERVGGAITGTSANISGAPPARNAEQVVAQLGSSVDLVLDGGETMGVASTVVDLTEEPPLVVREGAIPVEDIEKALGRRLRRVSVAD